jgi:hypothetical protein
MDELYSTNNMDDIAALLNQIEPGSGSPSQVSEDEQDSAIESTSTDERDINSTLEISDMLSYTHPYDNAISAYHADNATHTQSDNLLNAYDLSPIAVSHSIVEAMTSFAEEYMTPINLDLF